MAIVFDIIVASENAVFADTYARLSMIPMAGICQTQSWLIGPNKTKELNFTGNNLSAQEALQIGLVNRVVPPDELQSVVDGIAQDILKSDQKAVRRIKYLINEGMKTTRERYMTTEALELLRWNYR